MQSKRPRINPLILALALAAVLMVWSVTGSGSGSTSGSTMSYSTVVHYFEHNQVTSFTLDRNTSVITLNLKETTGEEVGIRIIQNAANIGITYYSRKALEEFKPIAKK